MITKQLRLICLLLGGEMTRKSIWFLLLAMAYSLPSSAQKTSEPRPVLVTNIPAQPVPTQAQGTTSVAGTVSLSPGTGVNVTNTPTVTVGNTANVNVANTPTVNVGNTPAVTVANIPAVTVGNSAANPVPIGSATHFAQPVGNLVTLFGNGTAWARALPDGTDDSGTGVNGWVVPPGQVLIVTDYSWYSNFCSAGKFCIAIVFAPFNRVDTSGAIADTDGRVFVQRQVTFALGPGISPVMGHDAPEIIVQIHGYLTNQ